MLIELLSSEELAMMDTWRRWYAWSNDGNSRTNVYTPMESILNEWDLRKSEYLAKLFGGELKITKRLHYKKSYEELQGEISDMMQEYSHYGRAERNGYEFIHAWNKYTYNNRFNFNDSQKHGFRRLMSDDCLISNIYDGYSFEVETRDGKPFRINRGCKVSKVLGKLANIFDLPGWEDFRICHSQILNQKDLGGELTISIHPLDYMTMSDNTYGWESCMSWEQEGSYRQGTVEMMNSKSVIIAYLAGNDGLRIGDDYWNSKKWRQLFVVDHNIIAGVKDYPYHNEDLGLEVVKWLKELAAERLNWQYENIIPFSFDDNKVHMDYLLDEKNDFYLNFQNRTMYNDFGCLDYHWMCFSTNIDPEDICGSNSFDWCNTYLPIPYSGFSQCMICGRLTFDLENESCLACEECQDCLRCDSCGEIACEISSIDGIQLCEYCWDNRVYECIVCGDQHYDENLSSIYVIPRLTPQFEDDIRQHWLIENPYGSYGFANSRSELEQAEYNFFKDNSPNGWICEDKMCLEKFVEKYLKPGERPHLREWRWDKEICVYLDQLNEDGICDLTDSFENDNESYINSFRDYHCQPTRFIELL